MCAKCARWGVRGGELTPKLQCLQGETAVVSVSRPVGGILCPGPLRESGSVTIHLCGLPVGAVTTSRRIGRASNPCPLLGLAPGGGYPAAGVATDAGALLPHPFTLACAPDPKTRRHRRSALCCPLPSDRSDLALASTLLCGVPTFLTGCPEAPARSPGRLTDPSSVAPLGPREQRGSEPDQRGWRPVRP